jgi:hypothetical protein
VLDEIVVSRFLVLRDCSFRVFLLFGHRAGIIGSPSAVGYGVAMLEPVRLIPDNTAMTIFLKRFMAPSAFSLCLPLSFWK